MYLWKIRKLCENGKLGDARDELDVFLEKYWSNENLTRTFNCLLYHAVQDQDSDSADYVIEKMGKYNMQRDNATYCILTLYYSELGLLDKGIKLLREMQTDGLQTSSRNYIPMIVSAARAGNLEMAFDLYDEMRRENIPSHRCYPALIQGVIKSSDCALWEDRVLEMLHDFRGDRQELSIATLETVAEWFER
jgi:pentatricopeptide repeat protein